MQLKRVQMAGQSKFFIADSKMPCWQSIELQPHSNLRRSQARKTRSRDGPGRANGNSGDPWPGYRSSWPVHDTVHRNPADMLKPGEMPGIWSEYYMTGTPFQSKLNGTNESCALRCFLLIHLYWCRIINSMWDWITCPTNVKLPCGKISRKII